MSPHTHDFFFSFPNVYLLASNVTLPIGMSFQSKAAFLVNRKEVSTKNTRQKILF